jgi:hypothetical protein
MSRRGNPVRIGDGPAAVTGDDDSIHATDSAVRNREGAAHRVIRKPEDLPESRTAASRGSGTAGRFRVRKWASRIDRKMDPGFFYAKTARQ